MNTRVAHTQKGPEKSIRNKSETHFEVQLINDHYTIRSLSLAGLTIIINNTTVGPAHKLKALISELHPLWGLHQNFEKEGEKAFIQIH